MGENHAFFIGFCYNQNMQKPPTILEIKKWLQEKNPLGFFEGDFSINDIDPKPWSGHFNFLVEGKGGKMVLRFKGPEWGGPARGIIDEYEILKAVEKYDVGPKVYWLGENFFGEPALLEEYLNGAILSHLPEGEQEKLFPKVAKFIAKINSMELPKEILKKQEKLLSYERHKQAWKERLEIILINPCAQVWGEKIKKEIIPKAEKMLDEFEERLQRVLENYGSVFVFKSAHIGHCLRIGDGFRFLNWEKNAFGDPSFSLAVFLASIQKHSNFPKIKKQMVAEYLKEKPVPEFSELVDQRLNEREISNLLWVLWAYARKRDTRPVEETGVERRFEQARNILLDY